MSNRIIPYNKQIDGLRFLAILSVMVGHFIRFDNPILKNTPFGYGVNLFFIISGFLITKILLKNKEDILNGKSTLKKVFKSFYYKRTLRIFPIYYLTIFFLLAINFQNVKDVWIWLVTYTTNFYLSFGYPYIGSFNHLWSLAVEEQFYLVWPFLIILSPFKYVEKIIIGIILLSLAFKIYYFNMYGFSDMLNASTLSCADSLGFGALAAYWNIYRPKLITKINKIWFIVIISSLPFIFFRVFSTEFYQINLVSGNFLFSIFSFFIIIKASEQKFKYITKFIIDNKIAVHIGKISYGIYLYHLFMPDLYNQFKEWFPNTFTTEAWFRIPFYFIAALIIAEASWFIIEKPILKLKNRFKYR